MSAIRQTAGVNPVSTQRGLGAEVVRAASQIRDTGTCDYADRSIKRRRTTASKATGR